MAPVWGEMDGNGGPGPRVQSHNIGLPVAVILGDQVWRRYAVLLARGRLILLDRPHGMVVTLTDRDQG